MKRSDVRVDQMNLRIQGFTTEQGRSLGELVARRLTNINIRDRQRQIPSLSLALRSSTRSIEQLADEIVRGIQQALK